jgi:hypothetical protein
MGSGGDQNGIWLTRTSPPHLAEPPNTVSEGKY